MSSLLCVAIPLTSSLMPALDGSGMEALDGIGSSMRDDIERALDRPLLRRLQVC